MSRQTRRELRAEINRAHAEHQATLEAQAKAEKLRKAAMQEEEARTLLNLGPEELGLMAARALVASEKCEFYSQRTSLNTRAVALSNLAVLSAMGAITGQAEQL